MFPGVYLWEDTFGRVFAGYLFWGPKVDTPMGLPYGWILRGTLRGTP